MPIAALWLEGISPASTSRAHGLPKMGEDDASTRSPVGGNSPLLAAHMQPGLPNIRVYGPLSKVTQMPNPMSKNVANKSCPKNQ